MAERKLPFRINTRKRISSFATRTVSAAGATIEAPEIPKVGLLHKIYLIYSGTITISTGTLANFGWNALKRIKVTLNQGSDNLVDLSGYGAQLMNHNLHTCFAINKAGIGNTSVDTDLSTIPTGDGAAQAFKLIYEIPISMNAGDEFELGLINLQATDLRARVQVEAGANADWGTGYTWVSGSVQFLYEYFEIPDSNEVMLPPDNVVIRSLEETTQLTTAGTNIYEFPRQGGVLQAWHTIKPNAVRNNNDVVSFSLRFNKSNLIQDTVPREIMKLRARRDFGVDLPTGSFHWNFLDMKELPNTGLFTNVIDTEQITTVESLITLTSSVTFGSNNNTVDTVRRIVQALK